MKIKKILSATLAALVLGQTLPLAACGGGDPFNDEGNVSGKYNISVGYKDSDGGKVVLEALKASYETAHPDVNIRLRNYGDTFDTFMNQNWANQANIPDVLWMPDNEFAGWAAGDHFLDLRSYYEADASTSYSLYYESMLDCASYSGEFKPLSESTDKQYGLYFAPRDYNKIVIAINRDLFTAYDVAIPDTTNGWTMNDFFALCTTIEDKISNKVNEGDIDAKATKAVFFQLPSEVVYTTMFNAMGSDGIIDANGNLVLNNTTNAAILDSYYDNLTNSTYKLSTNVSDFERGLCFMRCIVRPTAVDLDAWLDNMDFLPFPAKKEDGSVAIGTGCSGYGISKVHADDKQTLNGVTKTMKDLAWDFIKFVISEEGQEIAGKTGLSVPVLKSLAENGQWRTAIGDGLNHDAFLAGDELVLNTYSVFEPKIRNKVRPHVVSFFNQMERINSGKKENRATLLRECEQQFEAAKR